MRGRGQAVTLNTAGSNVTRLRHALPTRRRETIELPRAEAFARCATLRYVPLVRETLAKIVAFPGRVVRNTSVVTRLSLVIVFVALISLVITSAVGLRRGSDLAQDLLRDRLTAIGAARAVEVEQYVNTLKQIAVAQAISPSTAEAIDEFNEAYLELELETDSPSLEDENAVERFYVETVAPELSEVRGRPVGAASLLPERSAAVQLQASYIVRAGDEPSLISDAGDGSRWSEVHDSLHQPFSEVAIQAGVDDLYLIEPTNNTIVYSTAKDIDFATSLLTGPHSGSALAGLIRSFDDQPTAGSVAINDFTSYTAAGGEATAFVASPIIVGGSLAGFVALRFGAEPLTSITTDDRTWTSEGETGETFLVARDDLMRSDARGFVEDESSYLNEVAAAGAATDEQIRLMQRFGTTVLNQPVNDEDVDAALDRPPGLAETTNIDGTEVLQARRALEIDGLQWAIITEVERQEIEKPVADFARNLLIAIALFLVGITFLATRWSERMLRPVRVISSHLRAVRAGGDTDEGFSSTSLPDDSSGEFVELATDIDTMLATLAERNADARARAGERHRLLRRMLPPQAVQRAEAGDRNVVDQVAHATIAVVVVHGLGPLLRSGSRDQARMLLDRFVEEADALAKQRGLERIRLTGDSYVAGCGTIRPHIDHAARTVGFVLDIRELVHDLSDDEGLAISISAGVDSGPVTVGLTGGAGLVYDAWGKTVQRAADLARRADVDTVIVSEATGAQLPATLVIDDQAPASPADGVVVTGRREAERAP